MRFRSIFCILVCEAVPLAQGSDLHLNERVKRDGNPGGWNPGSWNPTGGWNPGAWNPGKRIHKLY